MHVSAADPLTKAGIVSQLRSAQGFVVSSGDTPHIDGVALVVADDVIDAITTEIRSLRARGISRVVLLVTWVNDKGLLAAAEAGVSGVIRRSEATSTCRTRASSSRSGDSDRRGASGTANHGCYAPPPVARTGPDRECRSLDDRGPNQR